MFVKFFTRSKSKKQQPIRVRFSYGKIVNGKKKTVSVYGRTKEKVSPKFWNSIAGKPKKSDYFTRYNELVAALQGIERTIIDEFKTTNQKIDADWLDTTIDKYYRPDRYLSDGTLFGYIQKFINNADKRINEKTGEPISYKVRREYEVTFKYLKAYAKKTGQDLDFFDMDKEFKENWTDYLRSKELHQNTIVRKLTTLKLFLNEAKADGKNPFDKYLGWRMQKKDTENVYLTNDELTQLYKHDFSETPRLEKVRDKFIVGAYTGLRFGDLQRIEPANIVNGNIHIRQGKTGHAIVIPMHPVVKEILDKYDGELPAPISNQKYNDYLKEACKKAGIKELAPFKSPVKDEKTGKTVLKHLPKYQLIGSHTARRTFATNAYLSGMDTLHIRAITGHKTETAFLKYLKVSQEQHANKIREFWEKQGIYIKAQ